MYTVYILRTSKGTLYTGQSNNLTRRLKQHASKNKKSAKYLRGFESFTLVYHEEFETLSQALKREIEIKKMTKTNKEKLLRSRRS